MQSFNCNNCGAGLQAPSHTQFVTCKYCQSQLAVKQSETAVYTEVIGEIQETVAEIHENVEVIRLQNELERLDREWETEKKKYTALLDETGNVSNESNTSGSGLVGIIIGLAVLVFMVKGSRSPGFELIIPLLIICSSVYQIVVGGGQASLYEKAYADYRQKRAKIEAKLKVLEAF